MPKISTHPKALLWHYIVSMISYLESRDHDFIYYFCKFCDSMQLNCQNSMEFQVKKFLYKINSCHASLIRNVNCAVQGQKHNITCNIIVSSSALLPSID